MMQPQVENSAVREENTATIKSTLAQYNLSDITDLDEYLSCHYSYLRISPLIDLFNSTRDIFFISSAKNLKRWKVTSLIPESINFDTGFECIKDYVSGPLLKQERYIVHHSPSSKYIAPDLHIDLPILDLSLARRIDAAKQGVITWLCVWKYYFSRMRINRDIAVKIAKIVHYEHKEHWYGSSTGEFICQSNK